MGNDFKKILNYLDKEAIEEILEEYEFPKSGKKEKLVEIILKNATVFECAVDWLFEDSTIAEIRILCDDLGIDWKKIHRGELEKEILTKLNKNIENINIENKINFLSSPSAFHKDDLEDILGNHGISSTGKKEKLVKGIARNDFLVGKAMIEWKKGLQKEDIKKMCSHLDIDSEGNRENLLQKIDNYVFKNEIKIDLQKESIDRTTKSIKNIGKTNSKSLQKNMRRGWSVTQKETVRIRQEGKCDMCKKFAPGWHYHHVDGDNSNNKMDNCVGLCPNCHYFELK